MRPPHSDTRIPSTRARLWLCAFALVVPAFGLAACDLLAEDAPARFEGRYRAQNRWPGTIGGPYAYTFGLLLANDADGVVSGSGTFVLISERTGPPSPSRSPAPPRATGSTSG